MWLTDHGLADLAAGTAVADSVALTTAAPVGAAHGVALPADRFHVIAADTAVMVDGAAVVADPAAVGVTDPADGAVATPMGKVADAVEAVDLVMVVVADPVRDSAMAPVVDKVVVAATADSVTAHAVDRVVVVTVDLVTAHAADRAAPATADLATASAQDNATADSEMPD